MTKHFQIIANPDGSKTLRLVTDPQPARATPSTFDTEPPVTGDDVVLAYLPASDATFGDC